ncbi:MAG TPA: TIGR03667 family PPOX class F420-dependent oxidoreductase [Ktedonobacterales bacterium]|nr:TIGR03667 family PPOX class F420-dependent oxidoreductase [Ktedonobacterales bacterium]
MNSALPDPSTPFGARVAERLQTERIIWLITVGANGVPQPNPVWFWWDGDSFLTYSLPHAARIAHIRRNPRVSLHFNSDGDGNDVIVFSGVATELPDAPSADQQPEYLARYRDSIDANFGGPKGFAGDYSLALRVTPDKVRGFLS